MLAEKLGMTLADLRERMTLEEMTLWATFYELRNDLENEAMRKSAARRT